MCNTVSQSISFTPIASVDAQLLILGSMPGVKSLDEQQYYAHPRNAFWPIMARLFEFDLNLDYSTRCQKLQQHKVSLWDSLKSCRRQGSLDQAIQTDSIIANDFSSFLKQHRQIKHIFFNGAKAEQVFKRYVMPTLDHEQALTFTKLPSTSPAHAAQSLDEKYLAWQKALFQKDHI